MCGSASRIRRVWFGYGDSAAFPSVRANLEKNGVLTKFNPPNSLTR
jgi:hypothetical protein